MRKIIIIGFVFLLVISASAQKEGLNWYFGGNAGLSFHSGNPLPLTNGALSTVEGCSTISSPSGQLMFYTDGITVYNRFHQVIANGLMGSPDATQSGVIVPVPNDTTQFYIFTVSSLGVGQPFDGFRYTLIDADLHDGKGGVVDGQKNILIHPSTTERVTSVHHKNDYGVWVIMHEWESDRFRAYLITTDGIDITAPVLSNSGLYHGHHDGHNRDGIGYMKLSPDGRRLAVAVMGANVVQVFDFNDTTGVVSNPMTLPVDTIPYGVEFSAGAEFLYASERKGDKIYQWNMMAGSEEEIIASRLVVGVLGNPFGGALQMASDGKIYIARKSKFHLSRIKYPYLPGMDCGFEEMGVELNGRQCKEGLPTFIQSYFNNLWILSENQCIDQEIEFTINSVINIDSIHWNFGDPATGPANIQWGDTAHHFFSSPGNYTITATLYHLITQTVLTEQVTILPLPHVELGPERTICAGDTAIFQIGNNFDSYLWMDDVHYQTPLFRTAEEGKVWIKVTDVCGEDYDTTTVYVQPLPEVELGKDTLIKYETVIWLDAGDEHASVMWQDGSALPEYGVDYPGTYYVDVWDALGCKSSDTIQIDPIPFKIHVPTAFSPNDDNINDTFFIRTSYTVDFDYELMVFNRWGELVFESNDPEESWDGSFQDVPCPMEVYVWVINAQTFEDNAFFSGNTLLKGTVTLLR
ncbi:MAG: gliding motility-associated C-terminal domain-containing protein [Bacteroidetes bacterium]|nr:gliding motility-associated C-terminal domain-containing protein [Bacteroidota bacterium]